MKEKKNIDRLFQEKFKDFEAHPPAGAWDSIVAAQKDKDDRKVVPLWWKLGGIAAALGLLIGLGTVIFNTDTTLDTAPSVVIDNTQENTESLDQEITTDITKDTPQEDAYVSTEDTNMSTESSEVVTAVTPSKTQVATTSNSNNQNNNGVATGSNKASTFQKKVINTKNNTATAVTSSETTPKNNIKEENFEAPYKRPETSSNSENQSQTAIAATEKTEENTPTENTTSAESALVKEKDLVAEAEKIASTQDEDIIAPKEPGVSDRWNVGAVAAPVYYSDFGGSGLDPQFKDNDKTGDVNLSYGVQVSYAVTPRLQVRTGVSNVDLSYSTNDLAFTTDPNASALLRGVDYSRNGRSVSIIDTGSSSLATNELLSSPQSKFSTGSVQQRLNYIEVPVEAVYTISDKRIGVSVIGGVSTLFLNNNDVLLRSDDLNASLGTSNSVNDLSFTTNVGIGVDYKITQDFKFNLEPAFKYQINGYDDAAGDFKPYFLGVYTGFSYKF